MNDDVKNALLSYRMERAAESVEAVDNAMLTSAMNRIYYAMFYAVLITKNASFCWRIRKLI